ncbi:hypothetical protein JXA88_06810 [Candidatus Fermentibacteria bacterium]|nr:hypothetical protein [Candidatus Fermentibacteria bacterium]
MAGVDEEGFCEGWGNTIPSSPSYRVLTPAGGTCRLLRPVLGRTVLRLRAFFHVTRPPVPGIVGRVGKHEWTWNGEPGWQTLCHVLPPGKGVSTIRLALIADGEPWFELRVVEVRLLPTDDPRVRGARAR